MSGLLSKYPFRSHTLLLVVPLIVFGCGNFDREHGAFGADDSGSLFNVEEVDPTYFSESTRQVDVIQVNCAAPGEDPDPEPFTDHFADVTFSNRPLHNDPGDEQTASTIYLWDYDVWYEPLTQGSPPLPGFTVTTINDGNGIQPCEPGVECKGEVVTQIEFVPVRLKEVLAGYLASTGIIQLEYNIYYRFYGENDFGFGVSTEGTTFFYAAGYDNCGN